MVAVFSTFALWGLFVVFFYFWGAELESFSVSQNLVRGFGVVCGVTVLDLVPTLWGHIDLRVWAWTCPLCYTDPLPCIDSCHDVFSVKCNIVIDLQTNKQTNHNNNNLLDELGRPP